MISLIPQIESAYGFKVTAFSPAPRGFVAETYYLTTDKGKYFIKIINNLRFAVNLPNALPVQANLAKRLDFIPSPLTTVNGEFQWISTDNKAISLYEYIDGKPNTTDSNGNPYGSEEDFSVIIPLAAGVYKSDINCEMVETFPVCMEAEFEAFLNDTLLLSNEVLACVNSHRSFIVEKWSEYKQICKRIFGVRKDFYITHGDMPGNLMVDANGKLYIIDWDDICIAPIERDFWLYMNSSVNIQRIATMLADNGITWTFSQDYYRYYLYTRFFDDLYGYMELDLLKIKDATICAKKIETEVFDWLIPIWGRQY